MGAHTDAGGVCPASLGCNHEDLGDFNLDGGMFVARTRLATDGTCRCPCLGEDLPNGEHAAPAIGGAAKATIGLDGRPRLRFVIERRKDVCIGQDVAVTHDHHTSPIRFNRTTTSTPMTAKPGGADGDPVTVSAPAGTSNIVSSPSTAKWW